jgi:hypothetical protein
MNDSGNARQQIVEKIKDSSTILVTVGQNPSVDELSAALGLTLLLNKLNKHATSVVSGTIPAAIDFLEPGKTFENTVDSLRDFIIALDKEKADHLRYKVEGDVVKIFITPYRTTINENDLDFSQGDYNVELVLALGVKDEAHLDAALEAHGRILHDATVATLTSGDNVSDLGSLSWHESGASSISEMLVSLSESLKADKPLLDEQISTAFLTGIVAATDRFSNSKTSSKVMTMAAQLMAAGANQQLIAAKLSEAHEITSGSDENSNNDGSTDLSEDTSTKLDKKPTKKSEKKSSEEKADGSLNIAHEPQGTLDEVAKEVQQDNAEQATEKAEDALAKQLDSVAPVASASMPTLADLQKDIASANDDLVQPSSDPAMPAYEPTLGGTLNATTEQAADEKRADEQNQQNHTILSHSSSLPASQNDGPVFTPPPFSAATTPADSVSPEPLSQELPPLPPLQPLSSPASQPSTSGAPTLAEIDSANRTAIPHGDALAAVHAVFDDKAPSAPAASVPDSSSQPAPAAPSLSSLPPLPDFSTLPQPPAPPIAPFAPMPSDNLGQIFPTPDSSSSAPITPPAANDPGQFKIPGQN